MSTQQSITPSKQYGNQIQIILVVLLSALYVAINLFRIGGDEFVINLNNNIANPLALAVAILAVMLWRGLPLGNQSRLLWAGLALGWGLWTIAEFWWGIAALLSQEVPYPSWADFFWLVGYVPMYYALWVRIRSLPSKPNPTQTAGIWTSVLIVIAWTALFVFPPILQANDPALLLESTLNILYPLVDLIVVVLVLRIFFSYQQGRYGLAWAWLSVGFIVHSISGLWFSYATASDLYYPDGQVNLISTLATDVPYNLSYVLWLVGLLALRNLQTTATAFSKQGSLLTPVPDTHILVFTKQDDTVMDVSRNFGRVFTLANVEGKSVSETLGVSAEETGRIYEEIKTKMKLQERPVVIKGRDGSRDARLSGIAVLFAPGEYSGSIFLLRLLTRDPSLDESISEYHKSIVTSVLSKTGVKETEEREIQQLVSAYYLAYIKALYGRIFVEGGVIMADALLTELQTVARRHGWPVDFHPQSFLKVATPSLSDTLRAFPLLLDATKQFVARVIDEHTVDAIVRNVSSTIDESIHQNVQRHAPATLERA